MSNSQKFGIFLIYIVVAVTLHLSFWIHALGSAGVILALDPDIRKGWNKK